MRYLIIILSILFVLFSIHHAQARIIPVPADSSTIQAGINGALNGDTVLVARGLYYERISFLGKHILVASNFIYDDNDTTIDSTIIDGGASDLGVTDTGSVVRFVSGEDSNSKIQGFTIQNGIGTIDLEYGHRCGGGIYCLASPIISNNTITNNSAFFGGAISCKNTSPTISNNTITGNSAESNGAGIFSRGPSSRPIIHGNIITNTTGEAICCLESSPTITNNTITGNEYDDWVILCNDCPSFNITSNTIDSNSGSSGVIYCSFSSGIISKNTITNNSSGIHCSDTDHGHTVIISNNIITGNSNNGGYGGGISCFDYSFPIITNNTINSNIGGIYCVNHSSPTIINNIISSSPDGAGIACGNVSTPLISYNDVWNNADGNFSGCDANLGLRDTININGDSCDIYFNISYDPLCADSICHLSWGSPCIEAGYNCAQGRFSFDFDEDPRVMDGDSNGVFMVDIGADEFPGESLLFGNVNGDGVIDIEDVVYLINYLFKKGPAPLPDQAGDTNCDGNVDVSDVVYIINYLFKGGLQPSC